MMLRSATRGGGADGGLDLHRIGGQPRDDLAGLVDVEEGGRQPGDMGEDVAAEIGDDALAERDDEIIAQRLATASTMASTISMAK